MNDKRPERFSPLPAPKGTQVVLDYIEGTLQALLGLRKQRNDGIRPELVLVHRTRLDGIIDILRDSATEIRTLQSERNEADDAFQTHYGGSS